MKSKTNKEKVQALKISTTTYNKVLERDNYACVLCLMLGKHPNRKDHNILECHHYINKSHLGMGIEQNLVMLCKQHHLTETKYRNEIKKYLMSKYDNWNEEDLVFRKGE